LLIQGFCAGPRTSIAIRKMHLVLAKLRPAAGYAESLALRADGLVTDVPLKGLECKIERDKMFIICQPPRGENDDYDNENSWISG